MLSQVQYKEGTLVLPKKFDYSKLKPLGGYKLDVYTKRQYSESSGSMSVFLMKYGRKIFYVPDMTLKQLKILSPEIFNLLKEWFPFSITQYDLNSTLDFSTVYHSHCQKLLPDYEFKDTDKLFYNILSLKNQSSKKGYYIAYGLNQVGDVNYLREGLYQNGELISPNIISFNDYEFSLHKEGNTHVIVNMNTNEVTRTNQFDKIVQITNNHIIGVNERETDYETYFSLKLTRKKDGEVLFKDKNEHTYDGTSITRTYELIGDRYFIKGNYSNGALDLKTGKKVDCPLSNHCSQFICDVTDTTFTDEKGVHPLNELPDLRWTGYTTLDFIKKFNGFIPDQHRYYMTNRGGSYGSKSPLLIFKGLENGIFYYQKGNELINLTDGSSFKVDDVMLSWVKKRETVHVFDKKPKDTKHFSILQPLKEGKLLNELYFEYSTLYRRGGGDTFKTNFLREEISFKKTNIIDIMCNLNGTELKLEIVCNIKDKKVTFETKINSSKFEVANIE